MGQILGHNTSYGKKISRTNPYDNHLLKKVNIRKLTIFLAIMMGLTAFTLDKTGVIDFYSFLFQNNNPGHVQMVTTEAPKVTSGAPVVSSPTPSATLKVTPAPSIAPTVTLEPEPILCDYFDDLPISYEELKNMKVVVSEVTEDQTEQIVFFCKYDSEKVNEIETFFLMEAFSNQRIFNEDNGEGLNFTPTGVLEGKEVKVIEMIDLKYYFEKYHNKEINYAEISNEKDLRQFIEKIVPRDNLYLLPMWFPEDEDVKNSEYLVYFKRLEV